MAASPQHFTLVADTEQVVTFDENFATVRVVVVANPAVTYFNTKGVAVPAVASSQTGNEVIPAVIAVVDVPDRTLGTNSVVRIRSVGTPTIAVSAW